MLLELSFLQLNSYHSLFITMTPLYIFDLNASICFWYMVQYQTGFIINISWRHMPLYVVQKLWLFLIKQNLIFSVNGNIMISKSAAFYAFWKTFSSYFAIWKCWSFCNFCQTKIISSFIMYKYTIYLVNILYLSITKSWMPEPPRTLCLSWICSLISHQPCLIKIQA